MKYFDFLKITQFECWIQMSLIGNGTRGIFWFVEKCAESFPSILDTLPFQTFMILHTGTWPLALVMFELVSIQNAVHPSFKKIYIFLRQNWDSLESGKWDWNAYWLITMVQLYFEHGYCYIYFHTGLGGSCWMCRQILLRFKSTCPTLKGSIGSGEDTKRTDILWFYKT